MKRFGLFLGVLLTVMGLNAQTVTPAPILSGQQIQLPLSNPPVPPASVSAHVTGNAGTATYYYWVVANDPIGNSVPSKPAIAMGVPNVLDASHYVTVSWTAAPGATSYDVLRTRTPQAPTGSCNCAIATGTTETSIQDQGISLQSYAVSSFDPATATIALTSKATGPGTEKLSLQFGGIEKVAFDSIDGLLASQIEGVRYASWFATGGTGTASDPWRGWEAAVNSAPAGSRVYFPAGFYQQSQTLDLIQPGIALDGACPYCVVIQPTSSISNDAILIEEGSGAPYLQGYIHKIYFDGSGDSNVNVNGIRLVDTVGFNFDQVGVWHFNRSGDNGMVWDNRPSSYCANCSSQDSERTYIGQVSLEDNTTNWKLQVNFGSNNSFMYTRVEALHLGPRDGQVGVWMNGNGSAQSAVLQKCHLGIDYNINDPVTPATLIKLTNGAYIFQGDWSIMGEQTSGTGGTFVSIDSSSWMDGTGFLATDGMSINVASGGEFYPQRWVYTGNVEPVLPHWLGGSDANFSPPLSLGGNQGAGWAGAQSLGITGDWLSSGQLNESIAFGNVAGCGFDFGSNIQHPFCWSYINDPVMFALYRKSAPGTAVGSGEGALWWVDNTGAAHASKFIGNNGDATLTSNAPSANVNLTPTGTGVVNANGSLTLNYGGTIPSGKTLQNSGSIIGGVVNAATLQQNGVSVVYTAQTFSNGNAQSAFPSGVTANQLSIYALEIPTSLQASKISYWVDAGDATTTDAYSLGIYNSSGTLVAHVAPVDWQYSGTGRTDALVEGTVTLPAGMYFVGLTGDAATATLYSVCGAQKSFVDFASSSYAATTSGALPATITAPTLAPAQGCAPYIFLSK